MKQLKFMLAAATAVGLAAAAQAATTPLDSEDFESAALKDDISKLTGFYYSGVAADNESEVVSDGASGQALKVNTGTVPVLRALKNGTGAAIPQSLKDALSVNVDTMVQFTVTPAGDPVTATSGDKLMIYLKETATTTSTGEGDEAVETTTYATNLVVKAAKYSEADTAWVEGGDDYVVTLPAGMEAVTTDKWYRLVVKAKAYVYGTDDDGNPNSWWPVFQVYLAPATDTVIDADDLCTFEDVDGAAYAVAGVDTGDDAVNSVFVSLAVSGADGEGVESSALALESVGFAGEGMIDNLVFTKEIEGATSVDFTFTWTDSKISAVTYSIGEVTDQAVTKDEEVTGLEAGSVITLTITPADWYKLASAETITYTVPNATPAEFVSLDNYVAEAAKVEEGNKITVSETTAPSDLGIAPGSSFYANKASADAAANLSKAMTWAMKLGGATSATKAAEVVNALVFEDDTETEAEQAYLLDCSTDELDGEDGEIAKFKFVGFDLANGGFTVGKDKKVGDGFSYGNGYVEVRGSATIGGAYDEAADMDKHNFFKAFLVPFAPVAK